MHTEAWKTNVPTGRKVCRIRGKVMERTAAQKRQVATAQDLPIPRLESGKISTVYRHVREINVLNSDLDTQSEISTSSFSTWLGLEYEVETQITFEQSLFWREYNRLSISAQGNDHLCLSFLANFFNLASPCACRKTQSLFLRP